MSFFDFPKEIFASILESLSISNLSALSLTCKALRTLTEPWLYSNIEMAWTDKQIPPIALLLRSLASRPELSDYVLRLQLGGKGFQFTGRTLPKITLSELELDNGIEFIQWTEVPYANLWIEELHSGTMDAIVALLVSFLPNLKSLHLDGNFTIDMRVLGQMLRSALCEASDQGFPKFHHLREVTFHSVEDPRHNAKLRKTADILSFFYLPCVERMSLSIDNPIHFDWAGYEPNPSSLTSLKLYRIRESRLGPLLSVCTNLNTLWWEWCYQSDIDPKVSKPVIELEQIATAISEARGTVIELTIEAQCYEGFNDLDLPSLQTKRSLSSITQLEKLKRLEIPWTFLMGFSPVAKIQLQDVIPKTVESLTITDDLIHCDGCEWDEYAIFYAIQSWLENWKAFTPGLRRVRLLLKKFMYEWEVEMRRELKHIFAQAGLEVDIVKLSKDIGRTKTPPPGWIWLTRAPPIME